MHDARWLLLAHQLPTRPSNARVKTWRRLQQLGAVPVRHSVYVLPNTEQSREDFEWMRTEIVALGGEATVFAANALNGDGDQDIVAAFQRARDVDYAALSSEAEKLLARRGGKREGGPKSTRGKASGPATGRNVWSRSVRTLRERFTAIERIDFHQAPAGRAVADTLAKLERTLASAKPGGGRAVAAALSAGDYRGRRWVTRPRPGVDRMASAWLIRRHIDPQADFGFVERPSGDEVPFDMYVGEFSHQGSQCTFETLARRFDLVDPAVNRIGQIVHDLDMKEDRYSPPEAPAVDRMIEGLRALYADDALLLQQGMTMFEALAQSFTAAGNRPRRSRRARHATRGR